MLPMMKGYCRDDDEKNCNLPTDTRNEDTHSPDDYIGRRGEGSEVYILISSYGNFGGMASLAKLSSFRFQNIFPLKSFYEALCRPSLCFSLMIFCADGNS